MPKPKADPTVGSTLDKLGGGKGGGKKGGATGMFSAVPGAFGLNDIQMTDPEVQAALTRSTRGIQESTQQGIQGLEDLAGRTGGSTGGLMAAVSRMQLQGNEALGNARKDAEGDILKAGWDRENQRAQLIEDLRKGQIAASAQRYSADQSRIGQIGAARISAGPAWGRLSLDRDMAPLEFMRAFNPYSTQAPQMQGYQSQQQPGWGASIGAGIVNGAGQAAYQYGQQYGKQKPQGTAV